MNDNVKPLRIAVFDVDRTLLVGTSGEVQLIRFLRRRRMIPLFNFVRNFFCFLQQLPRGIEKVILSKSVYLRGLNADEIKSLLPEFFEGYLKPRFSKQVQKYIENFRKKGYMIMLVSGTLDFILDYLVERLRADGGVGSTVEIREGKFTGRILGIHPYFRGKVLAIHKYFEGQKIDYKHSFGFADGWADVPLLSLFGNPVAVNPSRLLKRIAEKRGWRVVRD